MRIFLACAFILLFNSNFFAQDSVSFFAPSKDFNKKKFAIAAGTQAIGYGGSLVYLSAAWYKDYNHTSFHSFNDGPEWLQMDKAGHFITGWYLARVNTDMYQWSGMPRDKAAFYGAAGSLLYMTGIEMLDGFSEGWGFSWRDMGANTLGCGLFLVQKLSERYQSGHIYKKAEESYSYHKMRGFFYGCSIKFSFRQTVFPDFRSELLGNNLQEQIIKDYNGQTYWLSQNISSFMKTETKFPHWLNIAFGYGADGMISGRPGYAYTYPNGNTVEFERYRQYYFSLDIDLSRIKTKSHFLKAIAETFCFIKIPAPALEWNKYGMKFHPLYY